MYDTHEAIDTEYGYGLLTYDEALYEHRLLRCLEQVLFFPSSDWDETAWVRTNSPYGDAQCSTLNPVHGDERDTSVDRIGSMAQGCSAYQFCMPTQACPAHRLVVDGSGWRYMAQS